MMKANSHEKKIILHRSSRSGADQGSVYRGGHVRVLELRVHVTQDDSYAGCEKGDEKRMARL